MKYQKEKKGEQTQLISETGAVSVEPEFVRDVANYPFDNYSKREQETHLRLWWMLRNVLCRQGDLDKPSDRSRRK